MTSAYLAIDLGASSGRAIVGRLKGDPPKLSIAEVHRFEHRAVDTPVGPVWDLTGLWGEVLQGLAAGAKWCRERGASLQSVGVDAWGVDWALIGAGGELLGLPHCYRDPQNEPACQRMLDRLGGFENLYERTGVQRMAINTLFQLEARQAAEPKLLDAADRLLFLPDLFHYWLSGERSTERTIASTSSMLDVQTGQWDLDLLKQLDLPTHLLGPICDPGTTVGRLRSGLAEALGVAPDVRVVAPASHDTASAVAAVPAIEPPGPNEIWAYLSSGTWSLLGAELDRPIVSPAACAVPLTNERGVDNSIRFLKNIAGLWIIQELRRELNQRQERYGFSELVNEARTAPPFRTLVDPNDPAFAAPGAMSDRLQRIAQATNQPEPTTVGQLVRCCLDSLALCYSQTVDQLECVVGKQVCSLHVVGGGSQNDLLNQLTAGAIGRPVRVGPTEATAIGNLLVQAMGSGQVSDLGELRQIVARSFPVALVKPPADHLDWDSARRRFSELVE